MSIYLLILMDKCKNALTVSETMFTVFPLTYSVLISFSNQFEIISFEMILFQTELLNLLPINTINILNMALFDQISKDIMSAMKARDAVRLDTLRNVKKYLLEEKTRPGANNEVTDEAALKIMQKLAKQGRESATLFIQNNRQDLADNELAQVAVIEEYLPKQLSEAELEEKLKAIIAEVGASSPQDMGKVMGVATKKLAGLAEGRAISACVKKLLA